MTLASSRSSCHLPLAALADTELRVVCGGACSAGDVARVRCGRPTQALATAQPMASCSAEPP